MKCSVTDFIQDKIMIYGVWEPNISFVFQECLSLGDSVVDIGANVGYYSLLAAKSVGPTGHVYAIEASPEIFKKLKENCSLNPQQNLHLLNYAATSQEELLELCPGPAENCGQTAARERGIDCEGVGRQLVEGKPVDWLLRGADKKKIRIIKIDVEGAELPIVQQICDSIDEYSRDLLIITEMGLECYGSHTEELFYSLVELGFSAFEIENSYNELWCFRFDEVAFPKKITEPPTYETNVVFARLVPPFCQH